MKENELRIGNLMQEHYTGKIITVIELTEKSITFSDSFIGKWQAEAIPLSEEILLKCGMTKANNFRPERFDFEGVDNGQFHIDQLNGRFVFRGLGMTIVYVDYLHDLQNLHFACKRTELNTSGLI